MQPAPFHEELAELRRQAMRLQLTLDELRSRMRDLEIRAAIADASRAEAPATQHKEPIGAPDAAPLVASVAEAGRQTRIDDAWSQWKTTKGRTPASSREPSTTELVIGRTWLNRVGAAVLLLGVAFFIKYSVDQGWIGPTARVVLAGLLGLALIAGGELAVRKGMRPAADGLIGCGVAILFAAVFGAYNYYHLVSPEVGTLLYLGVTSLSTLVALHSGIEAIAVMAALGGYATPMALSTGEDRQVALLSYVFFLNCAFLAIGRRRGWDSLRILAWIATAFLFSAWAVKFYRLEALWQTWGFLAAFYALFHVDAIVPRTATDRQVPALNAVIVRAGNIVLFGLTFLMWKRDHAQWLGAFAVAAGAAQWLAAWRSRPVPARQGGVRLTLVLDGAGMLAMFAPLQFDRYLVTVAWSVQALATLCFCRRLPELWLRVKAAGLLVAALGHLFVLDLPDLELRVRLIEIGAWYVNWFTLLAASLALTAHTGAAVLLLDRDARKRDRDLAAGLVVGGTTLLLFLFAHQWERYIASWWWIGLASAWLIASTRSSVCSVGAFALVIAGVAKYLAWDTVAAVETGAWESIRGLVLNRAVITGVVVATMALVARAVLPKRLEASAIGIGAVGAAAALSVATALVLLWCGTFEIGRAFRFEEIAKRWSDPKLAMQMALSLFWALAATACLLVGFSRRAAELRYLALIVYSVTVAKVFFIDLARLGTGYRMVSFIVLGVLLLFASLLYQRLSGRVVRASGS